MPTTDKATVKKLMELFLHRRDVFAEQYVKMVGNEPHSAYKLVKKPITEALLLQHIRGEITAGTYLIDPHTNTVKLLCFDLDYGTKESAQKDVSRLYKKCCRFFKESAVAVEFSGRKGYHVWVFFAEPIPAALARYWGKQILKKVNLLKVELFPKQDYTTNYGNLLKLPLGKHKLGDWTEFVNGKNPNKVAHGKLFQIEPFMVTEEMVNEWKKRVEKKPQKTWDECGVVYPRYRGPHPPCIEWLLRGVAGPEEPDRTIPRHDAALAIAGYMINLRAEDPSKVEQLLLGWNKRNRPPLPKEREEELTKVIRDCLENGYNYGCHSEPYAYGCDEKECPLKHPELAVSEKEEFSKEVVDAAQKLLDRPDLVPYIHKALQEIVGEEKTKVFMFFLNLRKQSIDLSGDSSTGKNTVVDGVLGCFPKESWWKITGASDKSIRYLPMNIGTLYLAERRAVQGKPGEESTAQFDIKLAISEGKLEIIVVEKDAAGKLQTKKYQTGIENIISTSTDVEIPPELQNRIWEMVTDPSESQNIAVRDFILDQRSKTPKKRISTEEEKRVLRCAVDILRQEAPSDFVIPFAPLLKDILRPDQARVRRDTHKLCGAIEAFALLHYRNRPVHRDESGAQFLVCLPTDFALAWQYGEASILGTFTSETERFQEWLQMCHKILDARKQLTSATLAWAMNCEEPTARRWLNRFVREGYLSRQRVGRTGQGWHYEYEKTPLESRYDTVEIRFDDLMKATNEWFEQNGYERPKEQLQDLGKKISGKILEVKVQRRVIRSLDDLPDREEFEAQEWEDAFSSR